MTLFQTTTTQVALQTVWYLVSTHYHVGFFDLTPRVICMGRSPSVVSIPKSMTNPYSGLKQTLIILPQIPHTNFHPSYTFHPYYLSTKKSQLQVFLHYVEEINIVATKRKTQLSSWSVAKTEHQYVFYPNFNDYSSMHFA